MKKQGRYDVSGLIEAQFEPGSGGRVLRNSLGIKSKRQMDKIEAQEQFRTVEKLVDVFGKNHRFSVADICWIHKTWLGRIYPWAGQYRQVNLSKGHFSFAVAKHIPSLMLDFEKHNLRNYTPCTMKSMDEVVEALSIVHVELVLIHPFRDGNGRLARIVASLMAFQAGIPALDFSAVKGRKRNEYFAAVRAGLSRNYKPMGAIFRSVVERAVRISRCDLS